MSPTNRVKLQTALSVIAAATIAGEEPSVPVSEMYLVLLPATELYHSIEG